MGSVLVSKDINSSENSLEKCQTLPSSRYRQKFLKHKPSFKSPVSLKRQKLESTITNSSKCEKNLREKSVEEKETTLRRSKRKKNCNSNLEMQKVIPTDMQQNDVKEIKYENIDQNFCFNLIPENVMKSLDRELFAEEEEEYSQNFKCTEDIANKNQIITSINKIDPCIASKDDNYKLQQSTMSNSESEIKQIECNTQCLHNSSQIPNVIAVDNEDNEKGAITKEEKIENKCTSHMTERVILDVSEHKKNSKGNNSTKCEITEAVSNDLNLDLLCGDIQKTDDINTLVNVMITEKICSENKHNVCTSNSNQTIHLLENDSINKVFCPEQDKNASDIHLVENLSDIKVLISSKNYHTLIDEQQETSLVTKNHMKKEQNEESNKISDISNNFTVEKGHNSSDLDLNSKLDDGKKNKDTKKFHDLLNLPRNQSLSKKEKSLFLTENSNSSNLQNTKTLIQTCYNVINNSENIVDKPKITTKHLETKRENLTILYMSALDYEKENEENILERIVKDNEVKTSIFHSDSDNECENDNDIVTTQKNEQMTKQNINEFSKDVGEQNIKIISEQQIYQSIQENSMLSKKKELNENTSQKYIETKSSINDFKIENTNKVKYDIITNENHLKNHDQIKYDSTCYNEINKQHDLHENFTTVLINENNISLPQTQNNFATYDNVLSSKTVNSENGETGKQNEEKYILKEDITFTVTRECFRSEENEKFKEVINDREDENMNNVQDKILNEDVEENFDMEDDFGLTASQINMIEINEEEQYKQSNEANPHTSAENCSSTHFGQDSLTVEIMDQLCYIKETVNSIKDMLKTFLMKNEERK